jgi:hypothetical protein
LKIIWPNLKSIFKYQNGLGSKTFFHEMFLKLNFTLKYIWARIPCANFHFLKNLSKPYNMSCNSAQADGGPHSRVCTRETLRSGPHWRERKFSGAQVCRVTLKHWKTLKTLKTLSNIVKHCQTLKNIEKHWKILKNIEKHWKTLKNIEKHWKTLKNIEKHWKTLKNIEKHW